jgi:hypothetical protein
MKVLVACEFSGTVRDAFIAHGHDALSCDLLPTEKPGPHYQGNVLDIIGSGWDLLIAHPPCTYLASMGIWWNAKRPERWPLTYDALAFVEALASADIPKIAVENPIGYLNKHWDRFPKGPSQIINPWQFGHEANKPTCLWLKNLPPLFPTKIVGKGEFYTKANGTRMSKWSHITSGTNKQKRAQIASKTFQGIADAMATQWG